MTTGVVTIMKSHADVHLNSSMIIPAPAAFHGLVGGGRRRLCVFPLTQRLRCLLSEGMTMHPIALPPSRLSPTAAPSAAGSATADAHILELGRIMLSAAALELLASSPTTTRDILEAHRHGHWPCISPATRERFLSCARLGSPFSARFPLGEGSRDDVCIIHAPGMGLTLVMLPHEAKSLPFLSP